MRQNGKQILLPDKIDKSGLKCLNDIAEFTPVSEYGYSEHELLPYIHKFDAIILRKAHLSKKIIEKAQNLKVIAKHGAGLDNVDLQAANSNNIVVCNTPGVNSRSVAEHTITLMFATRRNLLNADQNVRLGKWNQTRINWDKFRNHELHGDVLGLFGFGNIARKVSNVALSLGMDCIVYDPYITRANVSEEIIFCDDKIELFESSDIVSIHAPLTKETKNSVGIDELRALGHEGIILNTARGEIISEKDLILAIKKDLILGAGLDVMRKEPPNLDNYLLKSNKTVVTPHMGGISVEATYKMSLEAALNVKAVFEGKLPSSTVNNQQIDLDLI